MRLRHGHSGTGARRCVRGGPSGRRPRSTGACGAAWPPAPRVRAHGYHSGDTSEPRGAHGARHPEVPGLRGRQRPRPRRGAAGGADRAHAGAHDPFGRCVPARNGRPRLGGDRPHHRHLRLLRVDRGPARQPAHRLRQPAVGRARAPTRARNRRPGAAVRPGRRGGPGGRLERRGRPLVQRRRSRPEGGGGRPGPDRRRRGQRSPAHGLDPRRRRAGHRRRARAPVGREPRLARAPPRSWSCPTA